MARRTNSPLMSLKSSGTDIGSLAFLWLYGARASQRLPVFLEKVDDPATSAQSLHNSRLVGGVPLLVRAPRGRNRTLMTS